MLAAREVIESTLFPGKLRTICRAGVVGLSRSSSELSRLIFRETGNVVETSFKIVLSMRAIIKLLSLPNDGLSTDLSLLCKFL